MQIEITKGFTAWHSLALQAASDFGAMTYGKRAAQGFDFLARRFFWMDAGPGMQGTNLHLEQFPAQNEEVTIRTLPGRLFSPIFSIPQMTTVQLFEANSAKTAPMA